ncbi:MAG: NADH-ubiquinone oxidoreductase-F iron-sulfur binding region domain-containing protein [Ilumatobacter sp.]|uniref:NADH-ubiquinone oxidoreductase-F iron-sulfur binding region domain-containing protein n=1 Tax=Ilumatobacter sp. TaxID=1967498 RepID=UPI0026364256|nr:NADH-ubiquinone oxidoreductase-F iron-sulfur binding region domain-containing protein [Ilumatobacter sp.]MDJ0769127.1 NADH-ubiquinone oxidoreductase-F iron-sulfur binding region domain-containing protein [Ilumatobacter sp.]
MSMRTFHALPDAPITSLPSFLEAGGGLGLRRALESGPAAVLDAIDEAGVRGRGGAGFPTGRKWRSVLSEPTRGDRVDVVVNAAEGEPGTFKDRALLRANPYLVLEGALVAAHTVGASRVIVATKAAYATELSALERAVGELREAGWLDGVEVVVVRGPDHYLYGEETALLEVIEGEEPLPRHLPPYQYGLFSAEPQLGWSAGTDDGSGGSNPSLVNNVETYAHVALVMQHGSEWYRSLGADSSPGPTIVTITGDVRRAVVAEVELGHPLREVIDELAGGVGPGRRIKAVLSGVSNPVLVGDALDAPMTYEALAAAGGGLGSAGFVVYDDTRNMVDVAHQVSRFLHVESCGQCNACKGGTFDITVALEQLVLDGEISERALWRLRRSLETVTDGGRCYLPVQEQRLITSLLQRFPDDLDERAGGAPGDPDVVLPKLVDLVDGVAVVDAEMLLKQPDWTYAETPVRLGPRVVREPAV